MSQTTPETGTVRLYVTSWCPYCRALLRDLDADALPYATVDVDDDSAAAEFVESVNGGNRVVPTVLFPDGSTLTNPSAALVRERLSR